MELAGRPDHQGFIRISGSAALGYFAYAAADINRHYHGFEGSSCVMLVVTKILLLLAPTLVMVHCPVRIDTLTSRVIMRTGGRFNVRFNVVYPCERRISL